MKAKKMSPRAAQRMVRGDFNVKFQPYRKGERPNVESHTNYKIQPVKPGERKPMPSVGIFRVKSCTVVHLSEISQNDAQAAGYIDKWELRRWLEKRLNDGNALPGDTSLWRIEWEIIQRDDVAVAA